MKKMDWQENTIICVTGRLTMELSSNAKRKLSTIGTISGEIHDFHYYHCDSEPGLIQQERFIIIKVNSCLHI